MASDWALTPSALEAGDRFRLLFVTSTTRDAASTDIGDYNRFVQERAAAGHPAIRGSAAGFRAVAATASVDARDNTCTTWTASDRGEPVHWLDGGKVAGDYADFYDGAWDGGTAQTDERGHRSDAARVWTGARGDGTADARYALGADAVAFGGRDGADFHPLHHPRLAGRSGAANALYGLSPVYRVTATKGAAAGAVRTAEAPVSPIPGAAGACAAGGTLAVPPATGRSDPTTGRPCLRPHPFRGADS